ncbi:hypothetical protein CcI49_26780 [Frankia sp. CcI49]|nr:hypothetical protein CcI49_26780 [Frankia sp. CcI49]
MAKSFWGHVAEATTGFVVGLPALGVGAVAGAATALSGGKFSDGFDAVGDAVEDAIDAAGKFGDKHSDELTSTTIKTVGHVVGGAAGHHHTSS